MYHMLVWIRHKPQVPRHLKPPSICHLSGAILRMQTDDVISINLSDENSTEFLFRAHAALVRGWHTGVSSAWVALLSYQA